MKIFNIKTEKNGKTRQKANIKNRLALASIKISPKNTQIGVRRISSGLFQYDGVYTLSRIPRRRK